MTPASRSTSWATTGNAWTTSATAARRDGRAEDRRRTEITTFLAALPSDADRERFTSANARALFRLDAESSRAAAQPVEGGGSGLRGT